MDFDWRQITKSNPRFLLFLLLGLFILFCFFRGCCQPKNDPTDFEIIQEDGQKILNKYTGSGKVVVIPKGIAKINDMAFSGCTSVTSVKIPKGVTEIGTNAFSLCSSLKYVVIPKSTTKIGSYAFANCSSLVSVKIPKSVTELGSSAFLNCNSLKYAEISEGITKIDVSVFEGCSSLTSVIIPKSVTEIENCAFRGCSSLKSIEIPKGMTAIGDNAFYGCSSLKTISIPDGVTSIGSCAFSGCSRLAKWKLAKNNPNYKIEGPLLMTKDGKSVIACLNVKSVKIPQSVDTLDVLLFNGCTKITKWDIPDTIPDIQVQDSKLLSKDGTKLLLWPSASGNVKIPEGVTDLGKNVFYGCTSLKSVKIPKGVTKIGDNAFCGCSSLKSIVIPEGVNEIGYGIFTGCRSLKKVTIPKGITKIEWKMFSGCTSLTSMVIPETVTRIESEAFFNCSSLKSVEMPRSVTYLAFRAFENCSSLKSMVIPENVAEIGRRAFCGCISLNSVEIPQYVTNIHNEAFIKCPKLTVQVAEGSNAEEFAKKNNISFKVLAEKTVADEKTELAANHQTENTTEISPTRPENVVENEQRGGRVIHLTIDSFTLPPGFQLISDKEMVFSDKNDEVRDGRIREYRNNNGEIIIISDSFMYFLQSMSAVEAIFKEGRKPDAPPELKTMAEGAVNQDVTLDGEALGGAILAPTKNGFLYYVLLGSDNNKDGRGVITIMVTAKSMLLPIAVYNMVKEGNYK